MWTTAVLLPKKLSAAGGCKVLARRGTGCAGCLGSMLLLLHMGEFTPCPWQAEECRAKQPAKRSMPQLVIKIAMNHFYD
jgi:hypothetical protein